MTRHLLCPLAFSFTTQKSRLWGEIYAIAQQHRLSWLFFSRWASATPSHLHDCLAARRLRHIWELWHLWGPRHLSQFAFSKSKKVIIIAFGLSSFPVASSLFLRMPPPNGLSGLLGLLALDRYETESDFSGPGPHDGRAQAHSLLPNRVLRRSHSTGHSREQAYLFDVLRHALGH